MTAKICGKPEDDLPAGQTDPGALSLWLCPLAIGPLNSTVLSAAPGGDVARSRIIGIRPFQPEDAAGLFAAARESLAQLCARMTWAHPDYSLEDCRAFVRQSTQAWASGDQYSFAIIDPQDGSFLGSVGLSQINRRHSLANLGYWVRTSRTRSGIASAAVLLAARFGLRELRLNRLEFHIPCGNVASQRVAQKVGAKFEGGLRQGLLLGGRFQDSMLYSLLAEELPDLLPCAMDLDAWAAWARFYRAVPEAHPPPIAGPGPSVAGKGAAAS